MGTALSQPEPAPPHGIWLRSLRLLGSILEATCGAEEGVHLSYLRIPAPCFIQRDDQPGEGLFESMLSSAGWVRMALVADKVGRTCSENDGF